MNRMTTAGRNKIIPPSSEVWFYFGDEPILKLPVFLFLRFVKQTRQKADEEDNEFDTLSYFADELPEDRHDPYIQHLISYLQNNVYWHQIAPFIKLPPDSHGHLAKLWTEKKSCLDAYSVHIRHKILPDQLFRYTRFHTKRLQQLFKDNLLYLPSPNQFNDPFDCSLDEETRLTFIGCGMGCFSTKNDDVLSFSHYADHHRGVCFGMNPIRLVDSMSDRGKKIRADIRPIWYFNTMPPLDFRTQPALCATCKHDIWSYEEEYRLFLVRGSSLLSAGCYEFAPDALTSVVFGCRASDKCISYVKSMTGHLPQLKYYIAYQEPNCFGVKLRQIVRL